MFRKNPANKSPKVQKAAVVTQFRAHNFTRMADNPKLTENPEELRKRPFLQHLLKLSDQIEKAKQQKAKM